jgi:hypothetical protein
MTALAASADALARAFDADFARPTAARAAAAEDCSRSGSGVLRPRR